MCTWERLRKTGNSPNGWNSHLKYQLKTKKMRVGGLGLQRGERQLSWRQKSISLVNKCLMNQAETIRHTVDSDLQAPPKFSHHTKHVFSANISSDSSVSVIGPLSKFFIHLGRRLKFLPESFEAWIVFRLFSIYMHQRHFGVANFVPL